MRAQLALRAERLRSGDRPLGWKVGFGSPAAFTRLGTRAPLVGFLTESARVEDGGTVSLDGWTRAAAEPEVAVHLCADLAGGAHADAARDAIAGVGPAIELADVAFEPDDVEAILAANVFQRHVVLGAHDPGRAGGSLAGLAGRVALDGEEIARTEDLEALTGGLVDLVAHVADTLAACGERLRAGDVVIAGSFVPPLDAEPGRALAVELVPGAGVRVGFRA